MGDLFKPQATRAGVSTAPIPGLAGGLEGLLAGFLKGGAGQNNPFQQQIQQAFQQLISDPGIITRQAEQASQQILDPAFQQLLTNTGIAQGRSSSASPARFSQAQRVAEGDIALRAQQDFNVFAAQTQQNAQQQALANLLGPLAGATGLAGQQQALQQQLLSGVLNLGAGPAAIQQAPSVGSQVGGLLGSVPGAVAGINT